MHKYLTAAGFSTLDTERKVYEFLEEQVIREENLADRAALMEGCSLREYRLEAADHIGICAGVLDLGNGSARIDYYYPYFDTEEVSSGELCTVERYTERENYAGVIDEYRIGLSLIFFINNPVAYRKLPDAGRVVDFKGTRLSAFCNEATVILPILKTEEDLEGMKNSRREQESLIEAARNGDEDAIETLTATDMDMFNQISKRIEKEDLYSVVEQSLMPCGVECDQYSIIGEIMAVDETENTCTGEMLWILSVICNEVSFRLAVPRARLTGEPAVGRRIKARIWLQGSVDFSNPAR